MRIDILSLYPQFFLASSDEGPLSQGMIGKARRGEAIHLSVVDIRNFAEGSYKKVDDRPYGGGPGMVLMPEPVVKALSHVCSTSSHVVYLSPQGKPFDGAKAKELAQKSHLVLLCGHYEGLDERVIENYTDEEISIGDYVLSSGCPAAIVVLDALVRFIPGVLGDERSSACDSFEEGLFDHPHYTRPETFQGLCVPQVLQQGNHTQIAAWRKKQAYTKTCRQRPEMMVKRRLKKGLICEQQASSLVVPVENLKKTLSFFKKVFGGQFQIEPQRAYWQWQEWSLLFEEENCAFEPTVGFEIVVKEKDLFEKIKHRLDQYVNAVAFQDDDLIAMTDPSGYGWIIRFKNMKVLVGEGDL